MDLAQQYRVATAGARNLMTALKREFYEVNGIQQINSVADMWVDHCTLPATVYAELAWKALGPVALAFITPSYGEVLENILEPESRRKCWRRRKRRRRGWRGPVLPDPSQVVADNLIGREVFANRLPGTNERMLWRLIGDSDRFLWYLMLFELGTDWLYNWSSAVNNSEYCDKSPLSRAYMVDGGTVWFPSTILRPVPLNGIVEEYGIAEITSGSVRYHGLPYRVRFGMTVRNDGPGGGAFAVAVQEANRPQTEDETRIAFSAPEGIPTNIAVSATIAAGNNTSFALYSDGSYAALSDIWVVSNEIEGHTPPQ